MCKQTTCPKCKKPTWAGCGAHVEQVLRDVPRSERCQCSAAAKTSPPKSWLRRRREAKGATPR